MVFNLDWAVVKVMGYVRATLEPTTPGRWPALELPRGWPELVLMNLVP
jgi:hypothetical protein